MRAKINQTFTLFTKLSIYTDERICLCVYSCVLTMMQPCCVCRRGFHWRASVTECIFAVGAHVVCLQLLWKNLCDM